MGRGLLVSRALDRTGLRLILKSLFRPSLGTRYSYLYKKKLNKSLSGSDDTNKNFHLVTVKDRILKLKNLTDLNWLNSENKLIAMPRPGVPM